MNDEVKNVSYLETVSSAIFERAKLEEMFKEELNRFETRWGGVVVDEITIKRNSYRDSYNTLTDHSIQRIDLKVRL